MLLCTFQNPYTVQREEEETLSCPTDCGLYCDPVDSSVVANVLPDLIQDSDGEASSVGEGSQEWVCGSPL